MSTLTAHENEIIAMIQHKVVAFTNEDIMQLVRACHWYLIDASITFEDWLARTSKSEKNLKINVETLATKINGTPTTFTMFPGTANVFYDNAPRYLSSHPLYLNMQMRSAFLVLALNLLQHCGLVYPIFGQMMVLPEVTDYHTGKLLDRHNEFCCTRNDDPVTAAISLLYHLSVSIGHNSSIAVQWITNLFTEHNVKVQELQAANKEIVLIHNPLSW